MKQVLQQIQRDNIVKLSQELIRIPSAVAGIDSGREQEIAEFVAAWLAKAGFETQLQIVKEGRPNVIGVLKGSGGGCSLMLNGHLDTIETAGMTVNPFHGEVRNERLYGRGAADMKGALAGMMLAGAAIAKADVKLKGDLMITGCVDEEGRGLGSEHLARSGVRADMAIVGELTSLQIGIAHKGLTFIDITTHGKAAHGSAPHYGVNAILAMNQVINALTHTLSEALTQRQHPLLGTPTFNIGFIEGGYRPNVVPDHCRISIDRRMIPGETYASVLGEVEEILDALKRENPEARITTTALDWAKCRPMEISPHEPVVEAISKSVQTLTGRRAIITTVPYWCDAASLWNIAEIPTAIFGPGDLEQAHSDSEFVDINKLTTFTQAIALTALDVCNRHPTDPP